MRLVASRSDGLNAELMTADDADVGHHRPVDKATRLFDKLDQLERKWQSQKSHSRPFGIHHNEPFVPTKSHQFQLEEREQPEAPLVGTFSTEATTQSSSGNPIRQSNYLVSQGPIESVGSFAIHAPIGQCEFSGSTMLSVLSAPENAQNQDETVECKAKKGKSKTLRVVSMFDRLYQKGKAKAIIRDCVIRPLTKQPKFNRNKRRQKAAVVIQSVFRGSKFRKHQRHLVSAALVIQRWRSYVSQRLYYLKLRGSVFILQSLERRRVAIQVVRKKRNAAVLIQGRWRVRCAKTRRIELAAELKLRICESNASTTIQTQLRKHLTSIRQQRVRCLRVMVEEALADEMDSMKQGSSVDTLSIGCLEESLTDEIVHQDETNRGHEPDACDVVSADHDDAKVPLSIVTDVQPESAPEPKPPSPPSGAVALYRAALRRRRALKQTSPTETHESGLRPILSPRRRNVEGKDSFVLRDGPSSPRKVKSIAYEYLPTKKTYYHCDAHKMSVIPTIQRWATKQLRERRLHRASLKIQCYWRIYRSQFHLLSSYLLKEW
jgi:hypothetical protein